MSSSQPRDQLVGEMTQLVMLRQGSQPPSHFHGHVYENVLQQWGADASRSADKLLALQWPWKWESHRG